MMRQANSLFNGSILSFNILFWLLHSHAATGDNKISIRPENIFPVDFFDFSYKLFPQIPTRYSFEVVYECLAQFAECTEVVNVRGRVHR
jgi:hypothetical protein